MVYDAAKLTGGSAHARNTVSGAEVTIRLPLRLAPKPVEPGLALLVEDSPDIRTDVREILVALGHSVIEAASVDEALALAREVPDISLVLSDISLEGELTGIDLLERLPAPKPSCVLMTSMPDSHPLYKKALVTAAVLRKPVSEQMLASYLGTETPS